MLIVTVAEYREQNPDSGFTDTELEKILGVSQQAVYVATCGRIENYNEYPEKIRDRIKKAIISQAEYIAANFGTDMSETMPQSATIGSFSYSTGSSSSCPYSPYELHSSAAMYLSLTGLLYRGGVNAI